MENTRKTLFQLHRDHFTGRVTIKRDRVEKTIYFKKGAPIYVESSMRSETLGQLLLEQGKITEEQYRTLVKRMEETRKRQGELICEMGFLSGFEVFEALKFQAVTKIQNLFVFDEAEFVKEEGEEVLTGVSELPIDFFRIFLDSMYSMVNVEEEGNPADERTLILTDDGKDYLKTVVLLPMESKFVRLLDGKKSFSQAVEACGIDPAEALALVKVMETVGYIQFREYTAPASSPAVKLDPSVGRTEKAVPEKTQARRSVEIGPEPTKASPIYAWALRCDRPYHELLKVPLNTSNIQIRRNFEAIVKELKLDAIDENYAERERPIATKVFEVLSTAVAVLCDEKRRQKYAAEVAAGMGGASKAEPDKAIQAEALIQRACVHAAKRKFQTAEAEFKTAMEMRPEEAAYHIEFAEFLLQRAIAEKKEIPPTVEQELKQAANLNQTDFRSFFQLGTLYKLKGDLEKARNFFAKVLEIKPDHPQASAELRLINRRLDEKKKNQNTLMNLFKKKDPSSIR